MAPTLASDESKVLSMATSLPTCHPPLNCDKHNSWLCNARAAVEPKKSQNPQPLILKAFESSTLHLKDNNPIVLP